MTTKINYEYVINEKTKKMMKHPVAIFASVVILTVLSHWTLVQLYSYYCAPSGWLGPLKTFLTLGSPMCHFVNLAQFELAKHYITIWIGAAAATATWITTKIV